MNWLHTAAIVFHVLIATGIVGLVLLQRGKGADAGAGFGAGASGTVFGARGSASFLSRTTATLAALFFATSLALAYLSGNQPDTATSVVDRAQTQSSEAPALPDAPPAVNADAAQQQIEAPTATTPESTQEQNE
jgi:preprotein translocase subunit SecG